MTMLSIEIAAIHGSVSSKNVAKFTMPNKSTPAANRSGYSLTPVIVNMLTVETAGDSNPLGIGDT